MDKAPTTLGRKRGSMFTTGERDHLRERLLARAEADDNVVGAAFTGSHAVGEGDRWSDTDLVLAVRGELAPTLERWTGWLVRRSRRAAPLGPARRGGRHPRIPSAELAGDRPDLRPGGRVRPAGPAMADGLRSAAPLEPFPPPDGDTLIGLLWHHALHARVCLERAHWWQAEHWISALRDHVITLACLRLGHPAAHAKGAHLLPDDLSTALEPTLVRSLTPTELHRALGATIDVVTAEPERSRPELAPRLAPMLAEPANTPPSKCH
ncbi:hypothetical protein ABZ379_20010 [Streptomyces canus]|uniref:hypothetical protein n=1 Tax=Streptomyces canus TaxID=58343 RepID=UPI003403C34C